MATCEEEKQYLLDELNKTMIGIVQLKSAAKQGCACETCRKVLELFGDEKEES